MWSDNWPFSGDFCQAKFSPNTFPPNPKTVGACFAIVLGAEPMKRNGRLELIGNKVPVAKYNPNSAICRSL